MIYLMNTINKYHCKTDMKPVDVNSSTYIDFNVENNDEDPKFEVGDHVRVSKYKNIRFCSRFYSKLI